MPSLLGSLPFEYHWQIEEIARIAQERQEQSVEPIDEHSLTVNANPPERITEANMKGTCVSATPISDRNSEPDSEAES